MQHDILTDDLKRLRATEAENTEYYINMAHERYALFMNRWGDEPCDEVDEIRRKAESFGEL